MLINAMLVGVITTNISLLATLLRLGIKHRDLLQEMDFGSNSIYSSVNRLAGLMEFIFKKKYARLNDPLLTLSCLTFVISFLISLPLVFLSVLYL